MRIIATAGHVDHGKSSLVRALTGTDPDRWVEERERGLTIDLGFAHFTTAGGNVGSFIDVPGHTRFISNMLAGVGAVGTSLLVVDAHEGWKPQTEEHLRILDLLGIRHGLVVLTKSDLCPPSDRERVSQSVRHHLEGTVLADAPLVFVSSTTGDGLAALVERIDDMLASTPLSPDHQRPRLFVDRVFAAKGSGPVVTGTLTEGSLAVGERVMATPMMIPARVRSMQSHGRDVDSVPPGSRVALNLAGIEHQDLRRGVAIVRPDEWHLTHEFDASFTMVAGLEHAVTSRGAWTLHVGSDEIAVRVRVIGATRIEAGSSGFIRVRLPHEIPLIPGDHYILRESGRRETVGGGEVLDVAPVLPVTRAQPDRRTDRVIAERGWVRAELLRLVTGEARTPTLGDWVIDPTVLATMRDELGARLTQAGNEGIRVETLDERERLVIEMCPDAKVAEGFARRAGAADPLLDHPAVAALAAGRCAPQPPTAITVAELRRLEQRGVLFERDGEWFHVSALETARRVALALLSAHPEGFTLSQFRESVGNTRKHAVPLATELDARGITRRRGDVRIAGPRLDTQVS
ncbi:MAG: selenocysteine-specific translation elongation factor, partial [Actinomycetota bacterium]